MGPLLDPTPRQTPESILGEAFGKGLSKVGENIGMQQKQSQLAKLLFGEEGRQYAQLPAEQQLEVAKLQQQAQQQQQKQLQEQEKLLIQQREAPILAKYQRGEELTQEEMSQLSPTSLRTLIGQQKPMFEPTEEKLEAERVSTLATEIETGFKGSQDEEMRLGRMEKLSDKGDLSTPMMVKGLEALGLPLGILGNPDTEEYAKLQADFLRDVRNVFPGGRITNYEIQAYLKTVPSLMNSREGKAAIIRNRKLVNEAKKLRYDAYRDILKENNGKKPRNLGLLIEDKIGHRMEAIEKEFIEGIKSSSEKFQEPIRMKNSEGTYFDIPPNMIEKALIDGLGF